MQTLPKKITLSQILRLFWVCAVVLVAVFLLGLLKGWHDARDFSDGLFIAAMLQLFAGGATFWTSSVESNGSIYLRYMSHASPTHITGKEIAADMLERQTFATQAIASGILTALLSVIVSFF